MEWGYRVMHVNSYRVVLTGKNVLLESDLEQVNEYVYL